MPAEWCPFAVHAPIGPNPEREGLIEGPDVVCVHTMVGGLMAVESYFAQHGYSGVESHWGVGNACDGERDGQIRQWQSTRYQADANYYARNVLSIETSDCGEWRKPWSPKQLNSIVHLVAWCCDEFDIPKRLIPDTKPGRRGVGYHRQGIDPWRVDGGVLWSSSQGKRCPGDARIAQIKHEVIPAIQGRDGGFDNDGFPDGLVLREGDSGYYVRKLQHALLSLGYDLSPYGVDGQFGPVTADAVRAYQRDERILVDGIAGPVTLSHLEEDMFMNQADVKQAATEALKEVLGLGPEGRYDDPTRVPVEEGKESSVDQLTVVDGLRQLQWNAFGRDFVPVPGSGGDHYQGQFALSEVWGVGRETLHVVRSLAENQGVEVDEAAIAKAVLAGLDPAQIAALVSESLPGDLAQQVADELGRRLNAGEPAQ